MAEKNPTDKIYEALTQGSAAVIGRMKTGNERVYRIANTVYEEVERGQKELFQIGRDIAQRPTDVAGHSVGLMEKGAEAQERAFELTRQLVDELATATRESRETTRKVAEASIEGSRAALDAFRGVFSWTRDAFESAVPGRTSNVVQTPARPTRRTSEDAA
jgi:hypothetical protein